MADLCRPGYFPFMSKGFPSIGRKPSPANPGNYARDFARTMKNKSRRRVRSVGTPQVKLQPFTTPIPVEFTRKDTATTGFEVLGIIFLISLVTFVAIACFG